MATELDCDILLLQRKGARATPADAIVVRCEGCDTEGLCRPSSQELARQATLTSGRPLRTLCRECGARYVQAALRAGAVNMISRPEEVPSLLDWIGEQRTQAVRNN